MSHVPMLARADHPRFVSDYAWFDIIYYTFISYLIKK